MIVVSYSGLTRAKSDVDAPPPTLRCRVLTSSSPTACIRAAIDMQNFTGDKAGLLQKEHCLDDVVYIAHPADGVQAGEEGMRFLRMHRRPDYARRDRIHPNSLSGELDRKRAGHGVQAALGQGG